MVTDTVYLNESCDLFWCMQRFKRLTNFQRSPESYCLDGRCRMHEDHRSHYLTLKNHKVTHKRECRMGHLVSESSEPIIVVQKQKEMIKSISGRLALKNK